MEQTILLVDDQPNNIKVLLSFLKTHDLNARVADSGERALQMLERFQPSLILMDVMMPQMDGFETCRRIKDNKMLSEIPVIFMTALDNVEDKINGFEAGGVDYITKPFHHAEVLARVSLHIKLRQKTVALQKKEKQIRMIVDNAPISIHELDSQGKFLSMNTAGLKMVGASNIKDVFAMDYSTIVDEPDRLRVNSIVDNALLGDVCQFEFKGNKENDRIFSARLVPIKDQQSKIKRLLGIFQDITEQKKAEEKIRNMAFLDALTQLPNRRLLEDRIKNIKEQSQRTTNQNALIYLDLDNFKPLNDTWGHKAGDLLLIQVAQRLTHCVRKMDTVSRIGGDEFVVLLSILDKERQQATTQAAQVAEKILAAVSDPYKITLGREDGKMSQIHHICTASMGVAIFAGDEIADPDEILKWADKAMYEAKNAGKNTIIFYK